MKTAPLFILSGMIFFAACSGSMEIRNTGAVDEGWAGHWRGRMLIENSLEPPHLVALDVEFTSTHIRAFLSDENENVKHRQVRNLRIDGDAIEFDVAYDTIRGLRAMAHFSGKRIGRSMMLEFEGSEGGRPYRGKWEVRRIQPEEPPITTQPTTSAIKGGE